MNHDNKIFTLLKCYIKRPLTRYSFHWCSLVHPWTSSPTSSHHSKTLSCSHKYINTIYITRSPAVIDRTYHTASIQYEHAPLRVHCAMLHKHPPVDPVLSCLSCCRKPSVGVCQVVSNSPDPGIVWPSARFPPDLWRWFKEDTASICRLIHSGYTAKQREATGLDNRGKWAPLCPGSSRHIRRHHTVHTVVAGCDWSAHVWSLSCHVLSALHEAICTTDQVHLQTLRQLWHRRVRQGVSSEWAGNYRLLGR